MPGYSVVVATAHAVELPLWRQLAAAAAPASVRELHLDTKAHPNAIQHRLDRWVRAGLVTRIEGTPKRYAMNDDTPRTPKPPRVARDGRTSPRAHTARDALWRAMRVLRTFDLPQVRIAAGASHRATEDFINCLQRSGHLRCTRRGHSASGTLSTYLLIRNTGRLTPQVVHRATAAGRVREVVDRNTGTRTDISPAAISLRSKRADPDADGGLS